MCVSLMAAVGLECVSGWRLLDIPPYWSPMPGQEIKKVPTLLCSFECLLLWHYLTLSLQKQRRLFSNLGTSNADLNVS